MRFLITALSFVLFATHANALSISDLSNTEASGGLKEALIQGAGKAVSQLSVTDGFFGNKEVKIPLPDTMKKAEKAMRMFGMGKQADDLVLKMNRAAEAAVPEAKALLVDSVKKMSLADAKSILTGGDMRQPSISKKPPLHLWLKSFYLSLKKPLKMLSWRSNIINLQKWAVNLVWLKKTKPTWSNMSRKKH